MSFLMIQGTASYVGKSFVVTALCRIFSNLGYKVAPFKAQNVSLNSWVTRDGKEISIAQAVQARAARVEPKAEMNPVLVKPKGRSKAQIIVLGKPYKDVRAGENLPLFDVVRSSLEKLASSNDIVIIEGMGSPAEINIENDIANMRIAKEFQVPVILVGDIERGGVFASLYGTLMLLGEERKFVKGIIINRFRGKKRILSTGIKKIERITGVKVLGVLPYADIFLPSEDSVSLYEKGMGNDKSKIEIVVVRLPHISNFTDFEALEDEANVRYLSPEELSLDSADALIIPGTKNTILDLQKLKKCGAEEIVRKAGKIPIIGICGGYQILGKEIMDHGIEGERMRKMKGLALLDAVTRFERYEKKTEQVKYMVKGKGPILGRISGEYVKGYEIHMGYSTSKNPVFGSDGCSSEDGLVIGTYLHGIFENENFRNAFLDYLYERKNLKRGKMKRKGYDFDKLADFFKRNVDFESIWRMVG